MASGTGTSGFANSCILHGVTAPSPAKVALLVMVLATCLHRATPRHVATLSSSMVASQGPTAQDPPGVLTVVTEADFWQALGNTLISTIIMNADISLNANGIVPGANALGVYQISRNVTVASNIENEDSNATHWYPILDLSAVRTAKIDVARGCVLRFHHLMLAHKGPQYTLSTSMYGYDVPFFDNDSLGFVEWSNSLVIMGACPPLDSVVSVFSALPRPPPFNRRGHQRLSVVAGGVCIPPRTNYVVTTRCYEAFYGEDIVWLKATFSQAAFQNTTTVTVVINTTFLCDQVITEQCVRQMGVINCTEQLFAEEFATDVPSLVMAPLTAGTPSRPPIPPTAAYTIPFSAPSSPSSSDAALIGGIVGGVVGGLMLLAAVMAAVYYYRAARLLRRASSRSKSSSRSLQAMSDIHAGPASPVEEEAGGSRQGSIKIEVEPLPSDADMQRDPSSVMGEGTNLSSKLPVASAVIMCDTPKMSESQPDMAAELLGMSNRIKAAICDNQLIIHSVIGSGAFGTVYSGWWKGLPVAVKSILFANDAGSGDGGPTRKDRVLMEAALSKSMAHPNVVATYSCDVKPVSLDQDNEPGSSGMLVSADAAIMNHWRVFIVQELCDGGSLAHALKNHSLASCPEQIPEISFRIVLGLAAGVASGMSHLHEHQVIHGDLNPSNVLLKRCESSRVTPKVCDFGLSVYLTGSRTHVSNAGHGTPFYIAPEVMHHGNLSKAADVYAMGVMLWELYMGRLVWQLSATGHLVASCTFPLLPHDAPSGYVGLIIDCLDTNPAHRPSFKAILTRLMQLCKEQDAMVTVAVV